MDVRWFEQPLASVSPQDDWLDAGEQAHCLSLRFAKRRSDWRLGRWTAKNAAAEYLGLACDAATLSTIHIRAAASGAPEVFVHDAPARVSISLSHRDGIAACALGPPEVKLGCDLETIEPRSDSFVEDYFTPEEQAAILHAPEAARCAQVALLWSAKESVLKVLRTGLRRSTRQLSVVLREEDLVYLSRELTATSHDLLSGMQPDESWLPLSVSCEGQIFRGRWIRGARLVRTLASLGC